MTGDLIKIEQFQDTPVRVVKINGLDMIPVIDIADSIGYDRTNLTKMFSRNAGFFDAENKGMVAMMTTGGEQKLDCLTRDGVIGLLWLVDLLRIKNPEKRARILAFRKWAAATLGKIMSGETVPVKREALEDIVRQNLQIADAMTQFAHVDRGIAASVALARVEYDTGADLTCYKALIKKDRQQAPGYLTPTQIGQELGGLSARDINRMLQQLGYQYYLGDRWQPTEIGKNFGENLPFAVSLKSGGVHSDYQLKWSSEIIRKLRDHLNGTRDAQAALPAGA